MVQWLGALDLNHKISGSNLLAIAAAPLGKALYLHCLVPQTGLKTINPLITCILGGINLSKSKLMLHV